MSKNSMVVYKFAGKRWALYLWIFLFWPAAVAYYFMSKGPVRIDFVVTPEGIIQPKRKGG